MRRCVLCIALLVSGCARNAIFELELSLQPHPNVVRLLGVAWSVDSARVVLIHEYLAGGNLATLLDSGRCREWGMAMSRGWQPNS